MNTVIFQDKISQIYSFIILIYSSWPLKARLISYDPLKRQIFQKKIRPLEAHSKNYDKLYFFFAHYR